MTTDIKRTAERIPLEVINGGNFGLLDELVSPTFTDHSPLPGMPPTRDGLKQSMKALKTAMPDIRYTVDEGLAFGDQVVHRLSASGTMTGDWMGIPATGKRAVWTEIHIGKGVDGRLTEHWGLIDQLAIFVQLGIVPQPGRVPATV